MTLDPAPPAKQESEGVEAPSPVPATVLATPTSKLNGGDAGCGRGAHQFRPQRVDAPRDGSSGSIVVSERSAGSRSAKRGPRVDPIFLRDARRRVVVVRTVLLWSGPVVDAVEVRLIGRVERVAMAR